MAQEYKVGHRVVLVSPAAGNGSERIGLKGTVTAVGADELGVKWDAGFAGSYARWRLTKAPIVD